jgi:hypothetical protein
VIGVSFRLRNVTIIDYFCYLILYVPKLLHISVVRPSSSRNIFSRIKHNGSVVSRINIANIFLREDGRRPKHIAVDAVLSSRINLR